MLIGNIYSITGLVSACVCFAILSSNNRIYEKDNVIRSYFSFLLINLIFCNLVLDRISNSSYTIFLQGKSLRETYSKIK